MEDIKPCPFCGQKPTLCESREWVSIEHPPGECIIDEWNAQYSNMDDCRAWVIASWNTRINESNDKGK